LARKDGGGVGADLNCDPSLEAHAALQRMRLSPSMELGAGLND